MADGKKLESANEKLWRLGQVRDQIEEFKQWFHPVPDEVAHLLYLAREWANLAKLGMNEKDLAGNKQYQRAFDDSLFPPLIKFCKDNLDGLVKYCEARRLAGKGTLRDSDIQTIKQLCLAADLETVEQLCLYLEDVDIAVMLARIMRTSYRALKNPTTLDDLSISELRGNLLEVIARTYADIIVVMREEAEHGVKHGIAQANTTKAARDAVRKLTDDEESKLASRAVELRNAHPKWSVASIATELHKDFPLLSVNSIRQRDSVKKLKKVAKAKGSVKK